MAKDQKAKKVQAAISDVCHENTAIDRLFEDHFLAAEALTLGTSETIVF